MPSILSRLFKPRWQHADPVIRADALSQLDWTREADRKVLMQVLAEDTVETVVASGLARVRDPGVLLSFTIHANPVMARAAEKHVCTLRGDDLNALCSYFHESFGDLDANRQKRLLHLLLAHDQLGSQSHSLLEHAASRNETAVAYMAMEHPRGNIRQAAAALVSDINLLEQVARILKRKDKGAYTIVRARIDEQKSRADALDTSRHGLSAIAHELETLMQSESWYRLDERLPSLRKRFHDLGTTVISDDAQIVELSRRVDDLLVQADNLVKCVDRKRALRETIEALDNTIRQLEASPPTLTQAPALAALISTQSTRWRNACEEAAYERPPADLLKLFDEAMGRLRAMQQSLVLAAQAQTQADEAARLEAQQQREADDVGSARHEAAASEAEAAARAQGLAEVQTVLETEKVALDELLKRCADSLEEGQSGQAALDLKAFDDRMSSLESLAGDLAGQAGVRLAKSLIRSLEGARHTQGQQLHELRKWASFAVQPKQAALLEQAERLETQPLAPKDKIQRMKALRAEWTQLGHCPDKRLYGRFQAAMNTIQKSCSAYFEEEKRLRLLNQQKREEILNALRKLFENDNLAGIELSALETIVAQSRLEWRAAFPVDRGAEKQLQSLFDELILKVDAPLNAAREAGKTGRLALIDDIRTRLDASSDAEIPQLIETVKAAQTRWKALPQTWRKDDRKLWLQFRALCDQCFERRDAVLAGKRDSQRQLGQILNARLISMTDELTLLATRAAADGLTTAERKSLDGELTNFDAQLQLVKNEARTAGEHTAERPVGKGGTTSRGVERTLERQIDALSAKVRDVRQHLESDKTRRVWRGLVDFSKAVGADASDTSSIGDIETRLLEVFEMVLGPDRSDDWLDRAYILQTAQGLIDEIKQDNDAGLAESRLRQSIVSAEIAGGVDTPPADQSIRMALQMQRLAELGQRNRPPAEADPAGQRQPPAVLDHFPSTLLEAFERGAAILLAIQVLPELLRPSERQALGDLFTNRWENLSTQD